MLRKNGAVNFTRAVATLAKGVLNEDTGLKVSCERSRWELDDWKPRYFINCLFRDHRYIYFFFKKGSWKEKSCFPAAKSKQNWQVGKKNESGGKRRGCTFKYRCHVKANEFYFWSLKILKTFLKKALLCDFAVVIISVFIHSLTSVYIFRIMKKSPLPMSRHTVFSGSHSSKEIAESKANNF